MQATLLGTDVGGLGNGALGPVFQIIPSDDSKVGALGPHIPCSALHSLTGWQWPLVLCSSLKPPPASSGCAGYVQENHDFGGRAGKDGEWGKGSKVGARGGLWKFKSRLLIASCVTGTLESPSFLICEIGTLVAECVRIMHVKGLVTKAWHKDGA